MPQIHQGAQSPYELLSEVETLPPAWGLVLLDRSLASGPHRQAELVRAATGCALSTRWLVAVADGRATTAAQSILRFAWYCADLPTPALARSLPSPTGALETVCVTDYHRFAVATQVSPDQRIWLARRGWHVLLVDEHKVLAADVLRLAEHIRAEHLHHLATVGLGGRHELLTA